MQKKKKKKKKNQKDYRVKKQSREKVIKCVLHEKATTVLLIVGLIKNT